MQDLAAQGDRRAAGVLALMQEPRRFIGTVQLAISALASSSAPWASRCCDAASIHTAADAGVVRAGHRGDDLS
jgi:CBS domain containing-hemolysin-like protein